MLDFTCLRPSEATTARAIVAMPLAKYACHPLTPNLLTRPATASPAKDTFTPFVKTRRDDVLGVARVREEKWIVDQAFSRRNSDKKKSIELQNRRRLKETVGASWDQNHVPIRQKDSPTQKHSFEIPSAARLPR